MSIVIILAIIGLCVICSRLSKFFTRIGKILEQMSEKAISRSYYKESIRPIEAAHNKALKRAKNEIVEAEYKSRVRKEIDALTK